MYIPINKLLKSISLEKKKKKLVSRMNSKSGTVSQFVKCLSNVQRPWGWVLKNLVNMGHAHLKLYHWMKEGLSEV